jgi:hypothetical protein
MLEITRCIIHYHIRTGDFHKDLWTAEERYRVRIVLNDENNDPGTVDKLLSTRT